MAVVIDLPSDDFVKHSRKFVDLFVRFQLHAPSSDGLSHRFAGLVAHRRGEIDEILPPAIL